MQLERLRRRAHGAAQIPFFAKRWAEAGFEAADLATLADLPRAPSYTVHSLLYDLDEHVCMMELAGIDAAWLTSAAGMCADLETSRLVNDRAAQAERDYRGRFIGAAHAHPLGGAAAFKELARCRHELGFQGLVITSEFEGKFIDDPALDPFWKEVGELDMFVFVHPALKLNQAQQRQRPPAVFARACSGA